MLTMATAILSLTPLLSDAPAHSAGRLPTLPFIWAQQRSIEPQPHVRLWFRADNLFRRGDAADLYFRTEEDAYVMIVRVDTDGRLTILSPAHARDHQFARGGRTYQVPGSTHGSFRIDDDPGMGYVFAVAAWEPFDMERAALGYSGAYRFAGQRIHGDPFLAVQDLADELLDDRYGYYAMDHVAYYVDRRYEYPRYLCYDCHAYRSYAHWNPYSHRCVNFRMVIYNDPYYYPYRYSRGSRVIYVRETRRPRYEFKGATRVGSRNDEPFIDYRFRGTDIDNRRPGSPSDDPNLPRRVNTADAGATRPGDDVTSRAGVGGRRVIASEEPVRPGPEGRLPRREGEDRSDEPRSPRRETGERDTRLGEPSAGERGTTGPRREPEVGGRSRLETLPPNVRTPRREEPESGRTTDPRRQERQPLGEPRRAPERRSEPRVAAPLEQAPPRREVETREPERRSEPARQAEPTRQPERRAEQVRQAEPRRQPERRAEPARQTPKRAEPRREPTRREAERKPPARSSTRPTLERRKP
jgi:hypothetical protein